MFDLQCLGINNAYWTGYYSNSKRPKSPAQVIEKLERSTVKKTKIKDAPDVDKFKNMMQRLNKGVG